MPRDISPLHLEYVDKSTLWPRWLHPRWTQGSSPAHQPITSQASIQATTQQAPSQSTQQSVSFVVVNQSSRPIPMQALLQLFSRYALSSSQLSPQQAPNQPNTQQASNQPSPQSTMVIVISEGGQMVDNSEDIINRLFRAQQPHTIPTSESFINTLQPTPITQDSIAKQPQCTVCMEEFHAEEQVTQLPCLHYFHQDCIKPWLQTQHTCPMCRHELPTDVPTQTPSQIPVYPALQYTSTQEQISQQVAILQPPHIPVSTVATSATPQPLAIASPLPHAPLLSSIPPSSSSSSTTSNLPSSSTTSNLPSTHEDEPSSSGTKRGGTPTTDEQASKKTKVEEKEKEKEKEKETKESGMKRSSEEQESSKKKKEEEKEESEVDRRRRRQGGRNEFGGLKKGFLL